MESKGYGYVQFYSKEDAQKAIDNLDGKLMGERYLRCEFFIP
jgi:RNA recognition motif-containing protein